jgi:hypothetical protein
MTPYDDCAISVTAGWNDWRSASARLGDLHDVHWHQPKTAPHPLLHAYVSRADIVGGNLPYERGIPFDSHGVRVCILKSRNMPAAYTVLARKADERRNTCYPFSSAHVRNVSPVSGHGWSHDEQ